jgi:hypothetical protein
LGISLRWLVLIVPMAALVGSAVAFFLWSLNYVTNVRFAHPWLLFLLPVAGLGVGLLYHYYGRSVEGGNNLIMDQIHQPGGGIPRRMAPLILLGTLVTHLFGGSAGREGTAVQMGGSIASAFCRWAGLESSRMRILLMAGIAAGFGAVFGTPLAGAVFALEVLMIGRIEYEALLPAFIAAVTGDWTCHAWGIEHTHYHIGYLASAAAPAAFFHLDPWVLLKVVIASAAFGWVSTLFAELSHRVSATFKRLIPFAPLRPAVGGALVIGLFLLVRTGDYLGLGVSSPDPHAVTIVSLFRSAEIDLHRGDAGGGVQGRGGDAAVLHRGGAGKCDGGGARRPAGFVCGPGLCGGVCRGDQYAAGVHADGDRAIRRDAQRLYRDGLFPGLSFQWPLGYLPLAADRGAEEQRGAAAARDHAAQGPRDEAA